MAKNCQKIENFISNVEGQDGLTIRNSFPPCFYIVTTLKFTSNWKVDWTKQTKMANYGRLVNMPKWFKGVQKGQPRCFWPFGPVWTLLDHFNKKHLRQTLLCSCGATNWFLSEMVQKCPYGPKSVPNCQKDLGLPFRTLLDPFVENTAMFGCFC